MAAIVAAACAPGGSLTLSADPLDPFYPSSFGHEHGTDGTRRRFQRRTARPAPLAGRPDDERLAPRPPRARRGALAALALAAALALCCPAAVAADDSSEPSASAACPAPATGFCSACDACCLDLTATECDACVAVECDAPHRCVAAGAGAPCNVCDGCCDKPYLAAQHSCDACVNATCAASGAVSVCERHGTTESPVECSGECWDSCVWAWLPSLCAPCVDECVVSPMLILVCAVFGLRLWDYVWSVISGAVCGTDGQTEDLSEGHAIRLRKCCLRWLCCCSAKVRAYAAVDEDDEDDGDSASQLERGTSTAADVSAVSEHLASMGLRREVAAERTAALLAEGHDTVELVSLLTVKDLQELGFKLGDLKKVAAFQQRRAGEDSETQALHAEPEPEPEPQPQPQPEPQLEPERSDTEQQLERQHAVGQVVWVTDTTDSGMYPVPWLRGAVEAHRASRWCARP